MPGKIEESKIDTYYFTDTSFNLLMQKRIRKILVVCSNYDFFILEEDGRIDEQIFNEYVSLNLRYPPVFIHADSARKAMALLETDKIDLIIEMLSIGDDDTFELANKLKAAHPDIPIVVLTHFSREVSLKLENEDLSSIDYVFCWLGNSELLLAIIKLIEDRMNAVFDVGEVGVQLILLVEDSIRYISAFLPSLYKIIFEQSMEFIKEALNEHQKMLRRRGRPKIMLAKDYSTALSIYDKYKQNILGIISDVSFRKGIERKEPKVHAGIEFCRIVKSEDKNIPFLLQSSDLSNEKTAIEMGAGFLDKHSKNLHNELKNYIVRNFGFGEFVFRYPDTQQEYSVAADLKDLQQQILNVPDEILIYHTRRDDISKWLNARALFPIAQIFKPVRLEDFKDLQEARKYIYKAISNFRTSKAKGIIAEFDRLVYDKYMGFARIGEGSIGGKARGLAFFNTLLKKHNFFRDLGNVVISIPDSVILSTEVFERFMEINNLYDIAASGSNDDEIMARFVASNLPENVRSDLEVIINQTDKPLAVRSSSKLEDSYFQPFAGIYNTYMIPPAQNKAVFLNMLENAIKCVYASVYFRSSKAYALATSNIIDEEKMGIIIQEVCGRQYGNKFYPVLSGTARSINFYPVSPAKAEDGIAAIAFGLGKYVAEGGSCLRFSPIYPRQILQLSSPDLAVKSTQKVFYALDMDPASFSPSSDDRINLLRFPIQEAESDGTLTYAASTYDHESNMIRDGYDSDGRKVITFSGILNYDKFPLPVILNRILKTCEQAMNNPVEIEFAVDLDRPPNCPVIFHFLQIRPIVINEQNINFRISKVNTEDVIAYSMKALGNGSYINISGIVYVKQRYYKPSDNNTISEEIEVFNSYFTRQNKGYVLAGPGRWGSADPWLGIPVKWGQISAVRIIVETGIDNYNVEPSQGTHFFHNLMNFGVGYLTVDASRNEGVYNIDYLDNMPSLMETEHLRLVNFERPLKIEIDGRTNKGVIYKPFYNVAENPIENG